MRLFGKQANNMIGELTTRQILALSNEGLDAARIAQELAVELPMVKLVLAAHDPGPRSNDRDIDDNGLNLLRQRALALALNSENEAVSARMIEFLIERDKPKKTVADSPNIGAINVAILNGRGAFNKLIDEYSS